MPRAKAATRKPATPKKVAAPKKSSKEMEAAPKKNTKSLHAVLEATKRKADVMMDLMDSVEPSPKQFSAPGTRTDLRAADRALSKKFPSISQERMDSLRNKDNESPADVVTKEVATRRGAFKYLSQEFWVRLEEEFDLLAASAYDSVPEPELSEAVQRDLHAALMAPLNKNPALRQVDDLKSYFEYCEKLNETVTYGLLMGCKQQVGLSECHRGEIENVAVATFGHFRLDLGFPHMFQVVADLWEENVRKQWLDVARMGRQAFVRSHVKLCVCSLTRMFSFALKALWSGRKSQMSQRFGQSCRRKWVAACTNPRPCD